MSANQTVSVEYTGKIATITLDNPKKLNALSRDAYFWLAALLREIAQREGILVTLLIGKSRFFSA